MGLKILPAVRGREIEDARELFFEYSETVDEPSCLEDFEREVAMLPGPYAPPAGRLFVGYVHAQAAGCVGLIRAYTGVCEMRRLYVRPAFRGLGLGRSLVSLLLSEARTQHYARMRLDTLDSMREAQALYRSLGFVEPSRKGLPVADTIHRMEREL